MIFMLANNYLGYEISTAALALGISFGFIVPFFANYLPIKSTMDKTLRNSLDLNKRMDD